MLRCIAVDDEPLALALLQDNISKLPYLQLVASCANALEAIKVMQEQPVDLMFIDIQMPGLTGLQLIETMVHKPMVILITAYKQYALESYNLDVVDYLVKPVPLERFIAACNKAYELYRLRNSSAADKKPATYFFVNVDYSLLKISFADVIWVEGLRDYIKIHLKSPQKPVVVRMSMRSIEDELPPSDFIRIHKSYLVAIESITAIKKSSVFMGDIELPVGDTYRDAIEAITRR
ncbi:LytR/AlgR family response regulator transcription factor [Flavihumibacter petaseus]|uniref:Putative two-component response regulator n=1 Tax=Flavihumibacter petaseus NBRC 106054 TaxID=1220578 RepID=A0A0E9MX02_9BACT|nr:response regulator transcription factor [Flavihumibacter petaseus]GAO41941.1 putative two-component response regulator [Flavihumibacter petaseus NBRC 106054]